MEKRVSEMFVALAEFAAGMATVIVQASKESAGSNE